MLFNIFEQDYLFFTFFTIKNIFEKFEQAIAVLSLEKTQKLANMSQKHGQIELLCHFQAIMNQVKFDKMTIFV
jgi:hypothetical protein